METGEHTQAGNANSSAEAPSNEKQVDVQQLINTALEGTKAELINEIKQAQATGLSRKDVDEILAKNRADIARAVSGESGKEGPHPFISMLAEDPEEALKRLITISKDEAAKDFDQKLKDFKDEVKQTREIESAYNAVLSGRKDITSKESAQKAFLRFYEGTNSDLSEKQRFEEALKEYDLFLEEHGAGDSKKRLDSVLGLNVSGSSGGSNGATNKSDMDYAREELEERKKRHKASRNW